MQWANSSLFIPGKCGYCFLGHLPIMWRFLKWFGFLIGAIVFVLAAAWGLTNFYKKEILAALNKEISKTIDGEISIEDIDFSIREFPTVSLTLNNVYLRGPQYARYRKDFFSSKKVYIDLYLKPLLHKEIVIRSIRVVSGNIYIFRTKSGFTNLEVFKSRSNDSIKSRNPLLISFDRFQLKDVKFIYYDSLKRKEVDLFFIDATNKITKTDSSNVFSLRGGINFGGIMLNEQKGNYLSDKEAEVNINLEHNSVKQNIYIHPSFLKFKKSTVEVSGIFSFDNPGKFVLNVNSNKLNYTEGLSLLTKSIQLQLDRYKIGKAVAIKARIAGGLLSGSKPDVDIKFSFANSNVMVVKLGAKNVTMEGSFTNHLDSTHINDNRNSMLTIHRFKGIIKGLPTTLSATVRNFDDPFVDLKSNVSLNLKSINSEIDDPRLIFEKGKFSSAIEYSGKLNEYLNPRITKFGGKLKGAAKVDQASFQLGPRKQIIENFNMEVHFDQNQLTIDKIVMLMNRNSLVVKGEILGFVPFFLQPEKKGFIRLDIYSKRFDFNTLLAKKSKNKLSAKEQQRKRKAISDQFDELYKKLEFNLAIRFDEVVFQRIKGTAMTGTVKLGGRKLEAKNISLGMAGGKFNLSIALDKLNNPVNPLTIDGTVTNADIRELLYGFNNFNQKTITYKNLRGRITSRVKLTTNINDDLEIIKPSVKGNIKLSVKNGQLIGFEPLERMSNFLMKKRDFENVRFGEIKSNFTIRGTDVYFKKMEIESSVLRLFMEGRYSLANHTDLSVQLPLSNLRRRDKNYKPANVGVKTKQGLSIFLHVYNDKAGKTIIDYDPFKKHVKSK